MTNQHSAATSPYLNKPCLTERERKMLDALKIAQIELDRAGDYRAQAACVAGENRALIAEIETATS